MDLDLSESTVKILAGVGLVLSIGLVFLLLVLFGRWLARRAMRDLREMATGAGMELVEGSWVAKLGLVRGAATYQGWSVQFLLQIGRYASTKLYLRLPRRLTFSSALRPGAPSLGGLAMPKVKGGLGIAKGWCDPPEAQVLLTPEIQRRLEGQGVARVTLTADLVEHWGGGNLGDAKVLRELLELMILVAERGLELDEASR